MKQEFPKNKKEFWNKAAANYDNSSPRFRDQYQKLAEQIAVDVGNARHILDLGTGTGEMALAVAEKAVSVEAVDLTPEMLEVAKNKAARKGFENITFTIQDASTLDFKDHTFDAVIASNLLHIIDRPEKTLQEIKRVLVPGGLLVAPTFLHGESIVSFLLSLFSQVMGFPIRHRFSTKSLARLIWDTGFEVISQVKKPGFIPTSYLMAVPINSVPEDSVMQY